MTTISDRIGLRNEEREFRLGKSFSKNSDTSFHSVRYDFKPASVDTTKMAAVDVGEGHQVTVTVPHIEGSGTTQTVFKGSKKPYLKECVLIVDNTTGEITLEKLSQNIQVKKTRAEGSSKIQQRPITPTEHNSKKLSPPQKSVHSPTQKNMWSSSQTSPNQHISPHARTSPLQPASSHRSPSDHLSPSMPSLVTPLSGRIATPPSVPMMTHGDTAMDESSKVGILSSSDSSASSSSGSSSSSESSDSEAENGREKTSHSLGHTNGDITPSSQSSLFSSMPKFSQLSEDLQLSESGSESD